MGMLEFVIFCFVVVLIAWVACWALGYFMPGHPGIIDKLIWGLAVVMIVFKLLQATGILGHDPVIPHV